MWDFPLFPESASTYSSRIDAVFAALILTSGTICFAIAVLLVYFGIKYRRGSSANRAESGMKASTAELLLVGGPTLIALCIFFWAAWVFFQVRTPPPDCLEIYVVGKQWMWKAQHPGGQREINSLHVPVDQPVRLILRSEDVIHSFYIPAFRVKQDVLPGRFTDMWFQATRTGTYHLFCAEYCGTEHSQMIGQVVVQKEADYQRWLSKSLAAGGTGEGMVVEAMTELADQAFFRHGCHHCHMSDSDIRAPNLEGLFNREVTLVGGARVEADEEYLRESILEPAAKVTRGYPPVMPSYKGQLTTDELVELIEYIKALSYESPLGNIVPSATEELTAPDSIREETTP